MRRFLILAILTTFTLEIQAQFVTIPDTNFRNWLNSNGFSACMNGNLMDTTCSEVFSADTIIWNSVGINNTDGLQYFKNLTMFKYSNLPSTPQSLRLDTIPAFPNSIKHLYFSGHSINYLPPLPDSLEYFNCIYGYLLSLPQLPQTLKTLDCGGNYLDSLPALPPAMTYLGCPNNNLVFIPNLPDSLRTMNCGDNLMVSLPILPDSLKNLNCQWMPTLTSLPVLPDSLEDFNCVLNAWTSLPNLPPGLKRLNCMYNEINVLPPLPSGLQSLYCNKNNLSFLPPLPNSLNSIDFGYNPITTFPTLPAGLLGLSCDSTNIISLPILPPGLVFLSCSHNPLSSLPDFPPTMDGLECENTFITEIPSLNDDMQTVKIRNNPFLTCFPPYLDINYLYWTNTPISCLPNAGFIANSTPSIAGLPICLSLSGCEFNWSMYGRIYNDTNLNCTLDTTEQLFKNMRVNLKSGGNILESFIFNTEGYFSFETAYGNYEIELDTVGLPFDVNCPATGVHSALISAVDSLVEDLDFGLNCKPGYYDLEAKSVSVNQFLIPGNEVKLYVRAGDASLFYGVTCSNGIGGSVQLNLNGPVTFVSADSNALTPTSVIQNTITWNIPDFSQVNPYTDFNIIISVDTTATIFDTLCVYLNVSPVNDNYPQNNFYYTCYAIHSSYDPNAKGVFPFGDIDTAAQWMNYTVYFQNTGNFPAEDIYIIDSLDFDLDKNTFQYLSSSHDPIIQLLPSNILKFSFPNINLPDSINDEPNSHGYVQYRIKSKAGLPVGTTITNTAAIYFDYNAAVMTNTVQNIITLPVGVVNVIDKTNFTIQPNPATHSFTISLSKPGNPSTILLLTDLTGCVLRKENLDGMLQFTIMVDNLAAGVYFVRVEDDRGIEVRRLVVFK